MLIFIYVIIWVDTFLSIIIYSISMLKSFIFIDLFKYVHDYISFTHAHDYCYIWKYF